MKSNKSIARSLRVVWWWVEVLSETALMCLADLPKTM
jgi:hypothetical protein